MQKSMLETWELVGLLGGEKFTTVWGIMYTVVETTQSGGSLQMGGIHGHMSPVDKAE